jgi:hypothetical protein
MPTYFYGMNGVIRILTKIAFGVPNGSQKSVQIEVNK